ncbi:MAG: DUF502 domain-containing protein [Rhodospirillaceae bacterium]|nr:DUF502 domain-containing protein [Rhodospirillaceae bacterium]
MSWGARLRGYFLAGILVTAPIGITVYIAWLFISFADSRVKPLIPPRYNPETYLPFSIPGIGLVLVIAFLILVGALTAGFVGRRIVRLGEGLLARMPVVRGIYAAVKQIFETVLAQRSEALREVVLFQYPRPGVWALGFITGTTRGETQALSGGEEVVNVFMPTTPNPTSGFVFLLPRSELRPLRMTAEEGLKLVVSGGIITPDAVPPAAVALTGAQRAGDGIAPEEVEQRS